MKILLSKVILDHRYQNMAEKKKNYQKDYWKDNRKDYQKDYQKNYQTRQSKLCGFWKGR